MTPCPTRDALDRICAADTASDGVAEIDTHVRSCAGCAAVLERISRERLVGLPLVPLPGVRRAGPPVAAGYRVVGPLGRGGMGEVWEARQLSLGRPVALKFIGGQFEHSAEFLGRFRTEAEAAAALQHPNIVQVFEARGDADGPFYAMELLTGGTLKERLDGRPLPANEAAALVRTLATAVAHAHARGVVHRDLKPANILFTADGQPKVADFGLAKLLAADDRPSLPGQVMGTPEYMAAEQTRGPAGPPADVYALGVILYECLTGRTPFRGVDAADTLALVRESDPVPPRRWVRSVPADLETVTLKCLSKSPADRYPTAAALADDLGRFLEGRPILARPPSWVYQIRKFASRRKALVGGLAATFASLSAGLVGTSVALARARMAEGERDAADTARRRETSERLFAVGETAARQGQWQQAADLMEEAIANGYPRPARARVEQVKAWYALNLRDDPAKQAVLDGLQGEADFAEMEGSIRLLRGDLLIGQDTPRGMAMVGEAVGKLDPESADAAYARALLADAIPDAIARCDAALRRSPSHHRARVVKAVGLFFAGRLAELDQEVAVIRALLPADPNVLAVRLMAAAVRHQDEAVAELLPDLERAWGKEQVTQFRKVVASLAAVGRMTNPFNPEAGTVQKQLAAQFGVADLQAVLDLHDGPPSPARLLFRTVPLLDRSWVEVVRGLVAMMRAGGTPAAVRRFADTLDAVVAVLPEGVLFMLLGVARAALREHDAAERAFRRAIDAPALSPVRTDALYLAAKCAWQTGVIGRQKVEPDAADRIRGDLGRLLAEPELPAGWFWELVGMARDSRNFLLARQISLEWARRHPDDPDWRWFSATNEYAAGDYFACLKLFDDILANNPSKKLVDWVKGDYEAVRDKCQDRAQKVLKVKE